MLNRYRTWRATRRHRARARVYRGPACGHSACSQNWVDTGDSGCLVVQHAAPMEVAAIAVALLAILVALVVETAFPELIMRLARWHG